MIKGGGYTRIEDPQRLVTEIEILNIVLHLVRRTEKRGS
jgi:hypothetical protein